MLVTPFHTNYFNEGCSKKKEREIIIGSSLVIHIVAAIPVESRKPIEPRCPIGNLVYDVGVRSKYYIQMYIIGK